MDIKKMTPTLVAVALGLFVNPVFSEIAVIVSPKSQITSLNTDQVSDIFLGKMTTLPDGNPIIPIDQMDGSPARNEFHSSITHKTPELLKAYWSKIIFTGKGAPPREAANDAAVKKMVADNPNVIGYIDKAALDNSVKPVITTGRK